MRPIRYGLWPLVLSCAASSAVAQELTRDQIQAGIDAAIHGAAAASSQAPNTQADPADDADDADNTRGFKLYMGPMHPKTPKSRLEVQHPVVRSVLDVAPKGCQPDAVGAPASAATFHEIRFGYDSAVIQPAALPTLSEMSAVLVNPKNKDAMFFIVGHTDAKGSAPYNFVLACKRAAAVVDFLKASGAPPEHLVIVGRGSKDLANPLDPDSEINRRVELRVASLAH